MSADIIHSASKGSTDRWENEGGPMAPRRTPAPDELQIELKRYGIVPVQLTVFEWGGYRYSNASDAIAAARAIGDAGLKPVPVPIVAGPR